MAEHNCLQRQTMKQIEETERINTSRREIDDAQ